jgi:hypothetical protein
MFLDDIPHDETIALPDPRVRTFVRLTPAQGQGRDVGASVASGTVSLSVKPGNFDARFNLTIAVDGGKEIRIVDGRYARLDGHSDKVCMSAD